MPCTAASGAGGTSRRRQGEHRKAEDRPRTGRTWTTPTTQREAVPGVAGPAGLPKQALAPSPRRTGLPHPQRARSERLPESMNEGTENPSNCFGCAPHNPIGLRLFFQEERDGFSTRFRLGPDYESFPGVIHGGIVAAILDETLAQTVYRSGWISAFTT